MGCCISTNDSEKSNPDSFPSNHFHHFSKSEVHAGAFHPRRRPSPPEEETVVKEVLSETPIPKPSNSIPITKINQNDHKNPEIEDEKLVLPAPAPAATKSRDEMVSEISEVSDLLSYSGSFSTTTVNEKKEDDGEVTQIVKSPARVAGKRPVAGENMGRKERGSRSPAAQRKHLAPRSAQSRNVGPANGVRRSRSPATRGGAPATATPAAGRHKSPSTSNAAGRFVAPATAPAVNAENDGKLGKGNDDVVLTEAAGEVESLENPLVSFECFIFL